MDNLEKKIALVNAITELSIKISTNTSIDIFVEYSSHTTGLSIRVMKDGWNADNPVTDYKRTVYLNWDNSEEELQEVIEYLETLKEEK